MRCRRPLAAALLPLLAFGCGSRNIDRDDGPPEQHDAAPTVSRCAVAPRTGERRVLGVVLDVGSSRNPCDEVAMRGVLFTRDDSLDAFYAAQSYGRLRFTGDAVRVALPESPGDCDEPHLAALAAAAEQAIAAMGLDAASYAAINYALPALGGARCGLAVTMASARPRVFVRDPSRCDYPNVYWHENAHALVAAGTESGGIGHAGLLTPDGQVMLNGDRSSVTGYTPGGAPFSAPERAYAGWLSAGETLAVTASGEHALDDLAAPRGARRLLRVGLKEDHPDAEALYVAYRRARDGFEAARPAEYDGVNVHRFSPCPSDYGTGRGGRQVHALLVGVLRQDGDSLEHAGVRLTLRRSDERTALVQVQLPP
jgi:hypothetical protein